MHNSNDLIVKGTRYYQAIRLFEQNKLLPGTSVRLIHQPYNPHDSNAVAVKMFLTEEMLGHLSRRVAPKYCTLLKNREIIKTKVLYAERADYGIRLDIRVYRKYKEVNAIDQSRLAVSIAALPPAPRVYSIHNLISGRQYIGSSNNSRQRAREHFRRLFDGCHSNRLLQSDFFYYGPDAFDITIISGADNVANLRNTEASYIRSLLSRNHDLYNMTEDGAGVKISGAYGVSEDSVSDRHKVEVSTKQERNGVSSSQDKSKVSEAQDKNGKSEAREKNVATHPPIRSLVNRPERSKSFLEGLEDQIMISKSVDKFAELFCNLTADQVQEEINTRLPNGDLLTHVAIRTRRLYILEWLLKNGADVQKTSALNGLGARDFLKKIGWGHAVLRMDRIQR